MNTVTENYWLIYAAATVYGSLHQVGGTICDGCQSINVPSIILELWLLINIVVISYWRWRDWFHSNLKNNCECALVIKDNRWYIYGCNNWHLHISCPNLVEWPTYDLIMHLFSHWVNPKASTIPCPVDCDNIVPLSKQNHDLDMNFLQNLQTLLKLWS